MHEGTGIGDVAVDRRRQPSKPSLVDYTWKIDDAIAFEVLKERLVNDHLTIR